MNMPERDWLCSQCKFGGACENEHCYMFKERPSVLDNGLCGQFKQAQMVPTPPSKGWYFDEAFRRLHNSV